MSDTVREKIYTNYRLQLPDQELLGTLVVRDGCIVEVQPGLAQSPGAIDGDGEYLLPGLIELHTDNFERCLSPRPGVRWPLAAAATYHDRDLAAAGVTTVCDAISVGDVTPTPGSLRIDMFGPMISTLTEQQQGGQFTVDHRLHLRCELGYEQVYDFVSAYADHPLLSLMSLMDHTPGQRQFAKIEKYKEYYMGKHAVSAAQMDQFIQDRLTAQRQHAEQNRQSLVALAQAQQIALASHDDATADHVQQAVEEGAVIAEFPTTLAAAKKAHQQGLQVLMGAPNLVLGGSHSGNVSAMDLVSHGLVDVISSDYVPQSLIQAMFLIAQAQALPLYQAMALFTANPARAIGLADDRGSLTVGKRADFVTVSDRGPVPQLTAVLSQGQRVA
ncbi:MAG: alpha-D-ribose 1-methylphosphonate 5-triphosphate diphosphatase [Cyanobacteria bacterium P01_A01_bin.105]